MLALMLSGFGRSDCRGDVPRSGGDSSVRLPIMVLLVAVLLLPAGCLDPTQRAKDLEKTSQEHYKQGAAYFKANRLREAADEYTLAYEFIQKSYEACVQPCFIGEAQNLNLYKSELLTQRARAYLTIRPLTPDLLILGRQDAAKAVELNPNAYPAQYLLGFVCIAGGDAPGAWEVYSRLNAVNNEKAKVLAEELYARYVKVFGQPK